MKKQDINRNRNHKSDSQNKCVASKWLKKTTDSRCLDGIKLCKTDLKLIECTDLAKSKKSNIFKVLNAVGGKESKFSVALFF